MGHNERGDWQRSSTLCVDLVLRPDACSERLNWWAPIQWNLMLRRFDTIPGGSWGQYRWRSQWEWAPLSSRTVQARRSCLEYSPELDDRGLGYYVEAVTQW